MSTVKSLTSRREGQALIVVPQSTMSSLAEDDFQTEFNEVLTQIESSDVRAVIVDFEQVEYFGSMMLEALRRLAARVAAAEGRMALCNVSEVSREILRITHFDTLWPIFDSREAALAAVQ